MKVTVHNGDKTIYSSDIDSEGNYNIEYLLNRELSNIKIFIFEEDSNDLSIFDNIDLNKIYITINYEDNSSNIKEISIPLQISKEYSNSFLF